MQGTMSEVNGKSAAFVLLTAVFSYYVIQNHFSLPNRYRSLVQDNERMRRILNVTTDTSNTISNNQLDLVERRKRLIAEKKTLLLDSILLFGMLKEKPVKNMVDESYPIEIQTLLRSVEDCLQRLPGLDEMKAKEASLAERELDSLSHHSCTDFESLKKSFEMLASWRRGDANRLKVADASPNAKENQPKEGEKKDFNVITNFIEILNREKDLKIREQKISGIRTVEMYHQEVENNELPKDAKLVDKSQRHALIVASDEDFSSKTVRSWLNPPYYGNIKSMDDACHNSLGIGLVEKWSNQRELWCTTEGESAGSATTQARTEISCYPYRQEGHSAVDNLCSLQNILFDLSELKNEEVTNAVLQRYVETKHSDEAYIHWKEGTLKGTCKKTENFKGEKLPMWNRDIISSYRQLAAAPPPEQEQRPSDKGHAASDTTLAKGGGEGESRGENAAEGSATRGVNAAGVKAVQDGAAGGDQSSKQAGEQGAKQLPEDRSQAANGAPVANQAAQEVGAAAAAGAGGDKEGKDATGDRKLHQHLGDELRTGGWSIHNSSKSFPRQILSLGGDDASRKRSWKPLECDEWEETTTIVLQRDTFANFFHDSEDFFNLFLALAILDLGLADFQLFFLDLYPRGPFFDVWTNAFAKAPGRVLRAWDVKNRYAGAKVCFSRLITGIVGPASPLTIHTTVAKCAGSPLVMAYADWMIRGLRVQHKTSYVYPGERKYLVITWMSRKSSVKWPELNFCEDGTFWKCSLFSHLGIRELHRVVKNEDEVIKKLQSLEEMEFQGSKRVLVSRKDYNQMPFREQIAIDVQTDIMIGPHGAGLTHSLFMPDDSFLIELGIDGSSGLKHFENMAIWRRGPHRYFRIANSPNPVQVDKLYDKVILAIDALTKSQS